MVLRAGVRQHQRCHAGNISNIDELEAPLSTRE